MSKLPRYYGIRKKHLISHLSIHTDKCKGEMPEDPRPCRIQRAEKKKKKKPSPWQRRPNMELFKLIIVYVCTWTTAHLIYIYKL